MIQVTAVESLILRHRVLEHSSHETLFHFRRPAKDRMHVLKSVAVIIQRFIGGGADVAHIPSSLRAAGGGPVFLIFFEVGCGVVIKSNTGRLGKIGEVATIIAKKTGHGIELVVAGLAGGLGAMLAANCS